MNRRSILRGTVIGVVTPVVAGGALPAMAAEIAPRRPAAPTGAIAPRRPMNVKIPNRADRLKTLPPQTTQVIIVGADSYSTTYAALETFAKVNGEWRPVFAPLPARIGSQGFSDQHTEGVPTTPTGMYAIGGTMYGIAANPGVRYPYHRLVQNDWWNENPKSAAYNTFQHTSTNPGGYSEALWKITPAYTHFAVITYNMPPNVAKPVPGAGSGIFLHEFSTSGGNATAGCVSLSHANLVRVLTWLDPATSPRIVLGPYEVLKRY